MKRGEMAQKVGDWFVVDRGLGFFTQYFNGTWECWVFLLLPWKYHKAPLRKYYRKLTRNDMEQRGSLRLSYLDIRYQTVIHFRFEGKGDGRLLFVKLTSCENLSTSRYVYVSMFEASLLH